MQSQIKLNLEKVSFSAGGQGGRFWSVIMFSVILYSHHQKSQNVLLLFYY